MFNLSLHGPASFPIQAPPPSIPIAPDFSICDQGYGKRLTPLLCGWAAETLMRGDSPLPYIIQRGAPGPQRLPLTTTFGNCKIWVEVAGPAIPRIYQVVPDEIRGMAGWVLAQCVGGSGEGHGGFATKDISKLTAYITEPDTKLGGNYPTSTAFLTVTITGPWNHTIWPPSPGNYDPSIAQHLAEAEADACVKAPPGSPERQDLVSRHEFFKRQSMRMQTGGRSIAWWGSNLGIATT